MPYSSNQKLLITQFVECTEAKDYTAARYLRAAGWKLDRAVEAYFQSSHSAAGPTASLNGVFDSYRDDPEDNPDGIGTEGVMKFLNDIQVRLDEVTCLSIAELVKSPSMGEFTREGFVNGWKSAGAETMDNMIEIARNLRTRTPVEPSTFRRIYRYAFPLCRLHGQRNLQFEIATEQWRLFFTPQSGGTQWNTATTPWLDWWIMFLDENGKRPVNKDLWEQVEVFMRKTLEDETLSWWTPDGAWPGTLDDFVGWVQARRKHDGMEE